VVEQGSAPNQGHIVSNDLGAVTIRVTPLLHSHSFDATDPAAATATVIASTDSTAGATNGSTDAAIDTTTAAATAGATGTTAATAGDTTSTTTAASTCTDLATATSTSIINSSSSPADRQLRLLQLQLLQQQRPVGAHPPTLGRSAAALLYSVLMLAPYAAGGAVRRVLGGSSSGSTDGGIGDSDPELASEYEQRVTALVLNYEVSSCNARRLCVGVCL
jgi:hypothetical protein